jgi:radical SAM superfamily enzyme YgiQ (UPF0313 family)
MKVMVSYPPLQGKGSPMLTQNRQFQWFHVPAYIFPLVPASAATLLKANGNDVIWNDCITKGLDEEEYYKILDETSPDLIAIETKTPVIKQHWRIINDIKNRLPTAKVVLMGDHVTAFPEESLSNSKVDFILTGGHYDFLLSDLVKCLGEGNSMPPGIYYRDGDNHANSGPFEHSQDLNSLPFIDRDLTEAHLYFEKWKKRDPFFYTMAGRDCHWAKCTFCSWTTTYPRFSVRKPENVLDEIGILIEKYGVKEIFDDTGDFPSGGWLKNFCNGMIERGYNKEILFSCNMRFTDIKRSYMQLIKKAGFRKIKSGLESANQRTLDYINKGIKVEDIVNGCKIASEEGIDVQLTVMVGYPWETKEEAENTLRLARELMRNGHAEMLQSTVVVPYPGTPLHKLALEKDYFRFDPKEYERFDMSETVLNTPDMSPEEVMGLCRGIYQSFFNPKFIFRNLINVRSLGDVKYLFNGFKAIKGHILDFFR